MKDHSCPLKRKKIRVLILSDRLLDEAKVLAGYLRCTGSFDVVGTARSRQQALTIAQEHSFDYLVIAGYLKSEYTYSVINELQKKQKDFLAVHWAILDSLITTFCQRYKIPLRFERTRSMEDFADFLEMHRNDPIPFYAEEL